MDGPNAHLLDRDVALAVAGEFAPQLDAIDDIVDYGTHLIIRVMAYSGEGAVKHVVPVAVLTKQVVAMLDTASASLRAGCGLGIIPIYRALYEAELQLSWILERDTQNRARAYWVAHLLRELRRCRTELPGSAYRKSAERLGVTDWRSPADVEQEIREIETALAQDEYAEIRDEVGSRFWATCFGCGGLEQMARQIDRWHEYEVFYRLLSGTSHATTPKGHVVIGGGQIRLEHVREPKHAVPFLTAAAYWTLRGYRTLIKHYRSEELSAFARRYAERWRSILHALPTGLAERSSFESQSVEGEGE